MDELLGVINIYKEKGFTSHDVVNIVRKNLGRIKTGHTGTLDPDAEGVLPVCVGKATKISELIASEIKEYTAEVILGITTDTLDISGNILTTNTVSSSKEEILEAVNSFVGEIKQLPPMYSAIKIDGKKLYELARKGVEIERNERVINIYNIEIENFIDEKTFTIKVTCGKGTYIRTLCDDIGKKLGCGGVMGKLTRTRTGEFYLRDSIKLEDFKQKASEQKFTEFIIPLEKIFPQFQKVYVLESANKFLYNGNKINLSFLKEKKHINENEKFFVYDFESCLIGIYVFNKLENCIQPWVCLVNR